MSLHRFYINFFPVVIVTQPCTAVGIRTYVGVAKFPAGGAAGARSTVARYSVGQSGTGRVTVSELAIYRTAESPVGHCGMHVAMQMH